MLMLVIKFNLLSLKLPLITCKQYLKAIKEKLKLSLFRDGLEIQQLND